MLDRDRMEELEAQKEELEEIIAYGKDDQGNPLTPEQIKDLELKIRDIEEEMHDMWFVDKYGIYAYYGVSRRDFM